MSLMQLSCVDERTMQIYQRARIKKNSTCTGQVSNNGVVMYRTYMLVIYRGLVSTHKKTPFMVFCLVSSTLFMKGLN